jgi:hypothetical protein
VHVSITPVVLPSLEPTAPLESVLVASTLVTVSSALALVVLPSLDVSLAVTSPLDVAPSPCPGCGPQLASAIDHPTYHPRTRTSVARDISTPRAGELRARTVPVTRRRSVRDDVEVEQALSGLEIGPPAPLESLLSSAP